MERIKELLANDVLVRAAKTFVQAFLSVLALGFADVVDLESAQALFVAAGAAGISAAWNSVKAFSQNR